MPSEQMNEQARELAREWLIRQDNRFMHETYMSGTVTELAALLARHALEARLDEEQKYEPMKEALQQFMKATLRIANDAATIVTLRLPCHCDAQDGTPCTRCNVIREIKALAERASKGAAK